MRILVIACASFAVAATVAAGCSGDHTGLPATPPFDPIGTEPTSADGGTGGQGVVQVLCDQSCANIAAACTNFFPPGNYCVQNCLSSFLYIHGCEAQQLTYLSCLATTTVDCTFGYPRTPECEPLLQAVGNCQTQHPPGGALD